MQLPTLLQSIEMEKMTGKLEIKCFSETAVILINNGIPVHCLTSAERGEPAMLDVLCWADPEGSFNFISTPPAHFSTIEKKLGALLLEAASLQDHATQLKSFDIGETSYLRKKVSAIEPKDLEKIIRPGFSLETQWALYNAIDGKSTLLEILRRTKLSKPQWMPCLSNLAKSGVIQAVTTSASETMDIASTNTNEGPLLMLDWSSVDSIEQSLRQPGNGLYKQEAFLLFLRREFERLAAIKQPFSIILFQVKKSFLGNAGDTRQLGQTYDSVVAKLIDETAKRKRRLDILSVFQVDQFALLLPDTDQEQCNLFSKSLISAINDAAKEEIIRGNASYA